MKIVDNKALMLRVKNPARVLAAVPDSKQVDDNTVVVKWGVEQVQVLRATSGPASLSRWNISARQPRSSP